MKMLLISILFKVLSSSKNGTTQMKRSSEDPKVKLVIPIFLGPNCNNISLLLRRFTRSFEKR